MDHFELVSQYNPTGDQPQAIKELVIRRWLRSCMGNSKSSFRITQWNTLSPTTTIISRKHMFHLRTHTLPRIRPSMTRLISFDSPQLCH